MAKTEMIDGRGSRELASNAAREVQIGQAQQMVQAQFVMAAQRPRDEALAIDKIKRACQHIGVAEAAEYEYPRGTTRVSGATIRMAEVIARAWGNIDCGVVEIEQTGRESLMLAYCTDLETNTTIRKQFRAKHVREKQSGNVVLTDPRDVYEVTANFAARRMRACILGVIPDYVVQIALAECRRTMAEQDKRPTPEKIASMVEGFRTIGVSAAMLETYLKHSLGVTTDRELIKLRNIFNGINTEAATIDDYFVPEADGDKRPSGASKADRMADRLKGKGKPQPTEPAPQEAPSEPEAGQVEEPPAPAPKPSPTPEASEAPRKPTFRERIAAAQSLDDLMALEEIAGRYSDPAVREKAIAAIRARANQLAG